MYEATIPLPAQRDAADRDRQGERRKGRRAERRHQRFTTPYFVSLDADSILDQRALKELMRVIQEDRGWWPWADRWRSPTAARCATAAWWRWGCPARSLPRFQMVEYLRSFTAARTGLDRMHAILILSGVFAVFEKETVIRAGGYLTPFLRHRLVEEYVGNRLGTVCEDMEIIVRLHRFVLRQAARPAHRVPAPSGGLDRGPRNASSRCASSGAAGIAGSASRCGIIAPCCGGPSSAGSAGSRCPAFWLFEYYGPLVEIAGYALRPVPLHHGADARTLQLVDYRVPAGHSCSPRSATGYWSTSSRCWWAPGVSATAWPTGCSAICCPSAAAARS